MKVLPKIIKAIKIISENDSSIKLAVNTKTLFYNKTSNSNTETLSDLIECNAFATTMLFLNENYVLDSNKSRIKDVKSYYNECESLLSDNCTVVEEVGIPLTDIKGYPIYEGAGYVLRGSGKKKIKECFKETEELSEEAEGTQTDDVAPKVDQELSKPTEAKPKKKKHYDMLLSGINEEDFDFVNKGFIKNSDGQYQRGKHIIVKEGSSYKAVRKY